MSEEILEKLDSAFKGITVTDLGTSVLADEKFDRFVRAMQARTNILAEARFIEMGSQVVDIDRVGFVGRVLTSGVKADGTESGSETEVKPTFNTNKLVAKEMRGKTGIKDRALRRNIERGNFENTLVDMFGEAVGRDMEEWGLFGDTTSSDALLALTDGWLKKAGNKLYGVESAGGAADRDFDPTSIEDMFQKMLQALPKEYLVNRAEWRFYVPFEVEDGYRNILKQRGTALGDATLTGNAQLMYKGIPIVYTPMLERATAVGGGGTGKVAILSHPDNMAWGVFYEVTLEKERVASDRATNFYVTVEGDVNYEDENGVVVAYMEMPKPAA